MPDRAASFLTDDVSNIASTSNVADALGADGAATSHKAAGSCIRYPRGAFAFCKVGRCDIRGKRYLVSGEKHYLADHVFKYAVICAAALFACRPTSVAEIACISARLEPSLL